MPDGPCRNGAARTHLTYCSRGYAAGVEDLARKLAGDDALSDRLAAILSAVRFKTGAPTR
jgi:hypothetical protein